MPINKQESELFFGVDIITRAKCQCGWTSKVGDCKHQESYETYPDIYAGEVIGISVEPVIRDLCPICKSEVSYV